MVRGGAGEPRAEGRKTHQERGGFAERACISRCGDSAERRAGPGGKGSYPSSRSGAQLGAAPAPSAGARGARHLPRPESEAGVRLSLQPPSKSCLFSPFLLRSPASVELRDKRPRQIRRRPGMPQPPSAPRRRGTGSQAPPPRWPAQRRRRRWQSCWH